jgi:hypothetical protein
MKPGIYTDMTAADYHADPCPNPSLTQSVAKVLLQRSPLHAWHAHPRLNPDYQHDDATKFDIGNIAHKMLLGRGKEIVVLEGFDDWRTKAAKEARDEAAAAGKLAVLGKHAARADRMVNAARAQLELRGLGDLFGADGDSEAVVAWIEDGFWFRQMIDWLSDDRLIFADYKTTDESAAPDALARKMVNDGWHIQAAMGERGLSARVLTHSALPVCRAGGERSLRAERGGGRARRADDGPQDARRGRNHLEALHVRRSLPRLPARHHDA